jgi:Transglutaminase-like superfamily
MSKSIIQGFRTGPRLTLRALSFAWREPRRAWLIMRMAAWVVWLSLMFKFLSLPRALKFIRPMRRVSVNNQDEVRLQASLAEAIDLILSINWLVFTPICWKRAAVLYRYLALNGIETRILFGLRRPDEGLLSGHAWVEAGGKPLFEPILPQYTVTYAFPA